MANMTNFASFAQLKTRRSFRSEFLDHNPLFQRGN
jgi:hypothetical protein